MLSAGAVDLLLRLMEAPALTVSASVLTGHFGASGKELLASGLLTPAGHATVVEDRSSEDGRLMVVEPDRTGEGLGYFSPERGWMAVEAQELALVRIDLARVWLTLLVCCDLRLPARGIGEIEADLVWDLGTVRLQMGRRTEVWYCRRVGDLERFARLEALLARRPASELRLTLTSTPFASLTKQQLAGALLVSVEDVLSSSKSATIDAGILSARFQGRPSPEAPRALQLSADNRQLTINGAVVIAFGGTVKRRLIRLLVEAHAEGRRCRASDLLEQSGSKAKSLDQAFGPQWKQLSRYVKPRSGTWGFEL